MYLKALILPLPRLAKPCILLLFSCCFGWPVKAGILWNPRCTLNLISWLKHAGTNRARSSCATFEKPAFCSSALPSLFLPCYTFPYQLVLVPQPLQSFVKGKVFPGHLFYFCNLVIYVESFALKDTFENLLNWIKI